MYIYVNVNGAENIDEKKSLLKQREKILNTNQIENSVIIIQRKQNLLSITIYKLINLRDIKL